MQQYRRLTRSNFEGKENTSMKAVGKKILEDRSHILLYYLLSKQIHSNTERIAPKLNHTLPN